MLQVHTNEDLEDSEAVSDILPHKRLHHPDWYLLLPLFFPRGLPTSLHPLTLITHGGIIVSSGLACTWNLPGIEVSHGMMASTFPPLPVPCQ